MQPKLLWTYSLLLLLGSILITAAESTFADNSSSDADFKIRGPRPNPVPIEPEPEPVSRDVEPLDFQVNYVYRPGGRGPLKALVDGSLLRSGDHYKIQFTPTEDSYVYIFQVDSSQAIYRLFPMKSFGGVTVNNFNPVRAGVTYHIPAEGKSFQLDDQTGTESIMFLAFRQENNNLEQRYSELIKARLAQDTTNANNLQIAMKEDFKTRGLAAIVDDPNQEDTRVSWTSEESFTMSAQRLNLCTECISIIKFEHR